MLVTLGLFAALAATAFALPPFTTAPKSAAGSGGQAELYAIDTACHADVRPLRHPRPLGDAALRRALRQPDRRRRLRGHGLAARAPSASASCMRDARAHTQAGSVLFPSVKTPLCPNLRQVKLAGDFEGVVSFGLGLRRKTGFRVFRLTGPTRIVIDVAH